MKALLLRLLLLLLAFVSISCLPVYARKKAYIVYLGGHSHGPEATPEDLNRAAESHHQLLASIFGSLEAARSSIFYSYTKHINGFAARLDEEEAVRVSEHPAVISVFENRAVTLHTTRTWDFVGGTLDEDGKVQPKSIWAKADLGEDIIIANIDTGVWPESESFDDEGYGPVPQKWKGVCQSDSSGRSFSCNRKLIGARFYPQGLVFSIDEPSPRDDEGHGTHTLSTAGGNFVSNASLFGNGLGTARGGAPRARVAAYKACWPMCTDVALLAAFDDAIADGVDVISLSVGGAPIEYLLDSISLGAFHAVQSGIVVAASAGNDGPHEETVTNIAPWIITVGASTVDREFASWVTLGNNNKIQGVSLASKSLPADEFYPLIEGTDAKLPNTSDYEAGFCYPGSLDQDKVKGKIVVCTQDTMYPRVTKGWIVLEAGGVGMILANSMLDGDKDLADAHFLPASTISYRSAGDVRAYLKSTESPTASISPTSTLLDVKPAPSMVFFSSRGPNMINPEILKPDITAPGVEVLAAFSMGIGPSMLPEDDRRVGFNVMSGTSMSCPHIAGVAGLVKKIHPDWSPAAIKSAIMTTARTRDNTGATMRENRMKSSPLDYGAGHVRPNRAVDPGLVYDLSVADYIDFLCTRSYNSSGMVAFIGKRYTCPSEPIVLENFNYPTITIPALADSFTITRKVKNVGGAPATYRARIQAPYGIAVEVAPEVLEFVNVSEERTFNVTVRSSTSNVNPGYVSGSLIWSDGVHYVRSPLVVNVLSRYDR